MSIAGPIEIFKALIDGWQPLLGALYITLKVTFLAFLIAVVLGVAALGKPLAPLVDYGSIPVALLTALSGAAYLAAWLRHMAEQPEEGGRP